MRVEYNSLCRNALTEVCVLADVLAIAKEKNYMVLDPVPQESADVKPMIQVYARKKALAGAASVLMMGAERLRNCQAELARTRSTPDFHIELLRLRQNWRLKKVSNSIIGDLSYRTGLFFFMYSKYASSFVEIIVGVFNNFVSIQIHGVFLFQLAPSIHKRACLKLQKPKKRKKVIIVHQRLLIPVAICPDNLTVPRTRKRPPCV